MHFRPAAFMLFIGLAFGLGAGLAVHSLARPAAGKTAQPPLSLAVTQLYALCQEFSGNMDACNPHLFVPYQDGFYYNSYMEGCAEFQFGSSFPVAIGIDGWYVKQFNEPPYQRFDPIPLDGTRVKVCEAYFVGTPK